MADTLQAKNSSGVRNLRDRLTAWDAKTDAKAPLTDKQKDGFIELTTLSANRPLPSEVAIHCLCCPEVGVAFSCLLESLLCMISI